jgi:hypothetical protein
MGLRSVSLAASLVFLAGLPTCGWTEQPALDRLEDLNRALAGEPGWTARYVQESIPVGLSAERAEGSVWLAWPDRALFHTGDPAYQMMGLSGRTVRLIDLRDETCDERTLTDREWERIPLAAVLDPRGALVHFTVAAAGGTSVVLSPKEPGGVDRVEIELGPDGLPMQVTVFDPQGAVNRLEFDRWRRADRPPGGEWLPDPPDGLECVVEPGALD